MGWWGCWPFLSIGAARQFLFSIQYTYYNIQENVPNLKNFFTLTYKEDLSILSQVIKYVANWFTRKDVGNCFRQSGKDNIIIVLE